MHFQILIILSFLIQSLFSFQLCLGNNGGNPVTLILTYKSDTRDRVSLSQYLENEWLHEFSSWVEGARVENYLILFSITADKDTWDAMVIMGFEDLQYLQDWYEFEAINPGGLTPKGHALTFSISTYLVELLFEGHSRPSLVQNRSEIIYFVRPYHFTSRQDYIRFTQAYTLKQWDAWIEEEVIKSFRLFFNQNPEGNRWDVLLLYEYSGIEGLTRRDDVREQVAASLAEYSSWALLQQIRGQFRYSDTTVLARRVASSW